MGTRHYQTVISAGGTTKIRQYGQWDGYPSGQGIDILNYLREGNLKKYQKNLGKIPLINKEQIETLNKDKDWDKKYPYLSRDCGSRIHKMIEDGEVNFVTHTSKEEADKWCEGFYTIDFSKNEFTSQYYDQECSFKLDALPTNEEYLSVMKSEDEDEDE